MPKKKKAKGRKIAFSKRVLQHWQDVAFPGSFSSYDSLYRGLQKQGQTFGRSKAEVKKILEDNLTYQVSRGLRKHFPHRQDKAYGINQRWEADLADLSDRFKDLVTGAVKGRYILLLQEIFTKKVFARALPNKTADAVLHAFQDIASQLQPPYSFEGSTLETDFGREFVNAKLKNFIRQHDMFLSLSAAGNKARHAERLVRSFKRVFIPYIESNPEVGWGQAVDDVAANLNRRYQSTIKMTPDEAPEHWKDLRDANLRLRQRMPFLDYLKEQKRLKKGGSVLDHGRRFKLGDKVVIPYKSGGGLTKESDRAYSYHVYVIVRIKDEETPFLYQLADGQGQKLKRFFYAAEMKKVKEPEFWPLSAIRQTQMRGRKKYYLVSWLDYPSPAYDQWIPASDLKKTT